MRRPTAAFSTPAGILPGRRLALALTVWLHLLAAFLWLGERRPRPHETPRVVSILLQLRAAPPAPASAPIPPPRLPRVTPPPSIRIPPAPAAVPTVAAPAPDPVSELKQADLPAAAPGPGLTLDAARRQAGRIDRELRQGKPGMPLGADTPWTRFGQALESAHVEPGLGAQIDSYTYPDGVVVYRKRVAGRSFCRRSGSVRGDFVPGASGLPGVNDAGEVACPKGVTWKQ